MDTRLKENSKEDNENNLRTLATKEDLFGVKENLLADISDLKTDLARTEGRLEVKITEVKSDIMRWMFAFFVTMMLSIIALYFKK